MTESSCIDSALKLDEFSNAVVEIQIYLDGIKMNKNSVYTSPYFCFTILSINVQVDVLKNPLEFQSFLDKVGIKEIIINCCKYCTGYRKFSPSNKRDRLEREVLHIIPRPEAMS